MCNPATWTHSDKSGPPIELVIYAAPTMQTDNSPAPKKSRLLKAFFKDDDDDEGPKGPGSAVASFFMPLFRPGNARPALA